MYCICEFDYQTGEWGVLECTSDPQIAFERLEWHLTNNEIANHRIVLSRVIPDKPW